MKNKVLLIILLLLFIPVNIQAYCTDQEKVKMNKLAGNVNFTPIFDENSEKFNLIVSNLSPDFYFKNLGTGITYNYNSNENIIYGLEPGKSYRFKFYSNLSNCLNENVLSKYITLPKYNKWYKDPICANYQDQTFCQKWSGFNYTYDEIVKKIENLNKNDKQDIEKKKKEKILGFYDYLLIIYQKYYFIILPIIIILSISYIIWKRKKDSELF